MSRARRRNPASVDLSHRRSGVYPTVSSEQRMDRFYTGVARSRLEEARVLLSHLRARRRHLPQPPAEETGWSFLGAADVIRELLAARLAIEILRNALVRKDVRRPPAFEPAEEEASAEIDRFGMKKYQRLTAPELAALLEGYARGFNVLLRAQAKFLLRPEIRHDRTLRPVGDAALAANGASGLDSRTALAIQALDDGLLGTAFAELRQATRSVSDWLRGLGAVEAANAWTEYTLDQLKLKDLQALARKWVRLAERGVPRAAPPTTEELEALEAAGELSELGAKTLERRRKATTRRRAAIPR